MSDPVCLVGRVLAGTIVSYIGGRLMGSMEALVFVGKLVGTALGVSISMHPDSIPDCVSVAVSLGSALFGTILGMAVLPGEDEVALQSLLGSTTCSAIVTVHASGRHLWRLHSNSNGESPETALLAGAATVAGQGDRGFDHRWSAQGGNSQKPSSQNGGVDNPADVSCENNRLGPIPGASHSTELSWMERDRQRALTSKEMLLLDGEERSECESGTDASRQERRSAIEISTGLYSWVFGVPW